MMIQAFLQIAFIKIDQGFRDSATRARKTAKHLQRTQGLIRFKMIVVIKKHQKKRNHQRDECTDDSVDFKLNFVN